jgi:hypothetical protein
VRGWGERVSSRSDTPTHTIHLLYVAVIVSVSLSVLVCPYVRTCVSPTVRLQKCLSGLESPHPAASRAPGEREREREREKERERGEKWMCVCVWVREIERERDKEGDGKKGGRMRRTKRHRIEGEEGSVRY